MSLGRVTFESAAKFLSEVALPNRNLIPDEVEKLQNRLAELNPQDRNASTLSPHRRSHLEREIAKLSEAINKKLYPIHLPQLKVIENQYNALNNFAAKLPLPYKELSKELKNLHPVLQVKIHQAIWLASGAPNESGFSKGKLESDPEILLRSFPPLLSAQEGPLLKQLSEVLAIEYKLEALKEEVEGLKTAGNHPEAASKQSEFDGLAQLRDTQKEAIFLANHPDLKITDRQLQSLFNGLPQTVKTRLPQPPYFGRGFNLDLYKTMGAHYDKRSNKTTFRVYAPNAREITLNLTAWGNVEHAIKLTKKENGIWEAQTEHAHPGRSYHFMIVGKAGGAPFKKLDPFAFGNLIHRSELRSENHESIVREIDTGFVWTDGSWMANRVHINPGRTPMSIYEIHSPTWKKKENGDTLNWRELAPQLVNYSKEMCYSHVELMALFEHPQPISMGYQITSFFALNSAMGSIEDFQFFINYLHQEKMGVIADWVPAHFANDPFSLCSFDGSPIYENDNPSYAIHPVWKTYEFDTRKQCTRDFLASNLEFLLQTFHFDGIRVDAVQSMLNYNLDREYTKAGDVNEDAKEFLGNLNTYVHAKYPGILMIAEEAMGFANLIRPVTEVGQIVKTTGVGFDLTWHMGFMNDTLRYFALPPHQRPAAYNIFSRTLKDVDQSDDFRPRGKVVLPFSHDESANGHGTIFTKMGGNNNPDKFANGRVALAYQLLRGGGPVLDFMGNEILQTQEWHGRVIQGVNNPVERKKASMQWEELDPSIDIHNHQYHRGARESRKDLLSLYNRSPGLHDQTDAGFAWIEGKDAENGVLSFHRKGGGQQYACIFNSSDKDLHNYIIQFPNGSYAHELDKLVGIKEVYSTDNLAYGGEGRNSCPEIIRDGSNRPTGLKLRLPPFTALLLEEQFC
jgi:1,4-alpha-glucan branching enzyme